jgi:hypothetical protein
VWKSDCPYLSFQITVGDKRIERASGEPATMQGITAAAAKAVKIAEALQRIQRSLSFWHVRKGDLQQQVRKDLITFADAITSKLILLGWY